MNLHNAYKNKYKIISIISIILLFCVLYCCSKTPNVYSIEKGPSQPDAISGLSKTKSRTFNVYPSGEGPSDPDSISGFSKIKWDKVFPGDIILLHDNGKYDETFYISGRGSAAAPITIKAVTGQRPVVTASIVIERAEFIVLDGITVESSFFPGIMIKNGSHHIVVSNNTTKNNGLGIWIAEEAGMNNRITRNEVFSNKTHGIAVDRVDCSPGNETIIADNRVYNNGHHGIEITGNYYIVEGNEVYKNGASTNGTSGIHFYAKNAEQNKGNHNIVRYNIVHDNIEQDGPDGNGIQLDQWCDNNQIYYNIAYSNDGAGISVFDSSNNFIFNNTLFNNMLDPGRSHPYRAELVLSSDYVHNVNHVNNITITNNIIVANREENFAIYIDKLTSKNRLMIGNNLFFHSKGSDFYFWVNKKGKDLEEWNQLAAGYKVDWYKDPLFVKELPAGKDDFRLNKESACINKGVDMGQKRDILGTKVPMDKVPDLGAIEVN